MSLWRIQATATAFGLIKSAPNEVKEALREKIPSLKKNPEIGKPLVGPLGGHRRLTILGRWRLIYQAEKATKTVYVKAIGIRKAGSKKDIYALARKLLRHGLM